VVVICNIAGAWRGVIIAGESGEGGGVEGVVEDVVNVLHTSIVLEFRFSID